MVVAGRPVEVSDTVGAGDMFTALFAAALVRGDAHTEPKTLNDIDVAIDTDTDAAAPCERA